MKIIFSLIIKVYLIFERKPYFFFNFNFLFLYARLWKFVIAGL
jgi:hypothetical protein